MNKLNKLYDALNVIKNTCVEYKDCENGCPLSDESGMRCQLDVDIPQYWDVKKPPKPFKILDRIDA